MLEAYFQSLLAIVAASPIVRRMYSYHYQAADTTLIFRYDDTPHHPDLSTFPHHKHDGSEENVVAITPPDLPGVLREIEMIHALPFGRPPTAM